MKRIVFLFTVIAVIALTVMGVSADRMGIDTYTGAFFLDSAIDMSYRDVGTNPFGIEKIRTIYIDNGSICSYGGDIDFAMPPVFTRVNYYSDKSMSNPESCYSSLSIKNQAITANELFDSCGITEGKALLLIIGDKYYMFVLNGGKLKPAKEETRIALEQKQIITVDGTPHELTTYAIRDENGGLTNYVRVRDIASLLNGTGSQFSVGWDNAVNLVPGEAYVENGTEFTVPFSGDQNYEYAKAPTRFCGQVAVLSSIVLTDSKGGGYTYYKLRDLGGNLNFEVDWTEENGIEIKSYNRSIDE